MTTTAFDMTRWREWLDHQQTVVVPRQRVQVQGLCETFERTLLEQYPDEVASIILEPGCSRLHFNDEGLTVESYGQVQRFTIPAGRGRPARVVTRPLKRQASDYAVVALLDAPYETQVKAMLKLPELASEILARHGRGDLVEAWRLSRASADREGLLGEGKHQRQEGAEEHDPAGVFDDRVGR